MIKIKCSKAQFDRIIKNILAGGCITRDNICVLGKSAHTCPYNKRGVVLECKKCLKENIQWTPNTDRL